MRALKSLVPVVTILAASVLSGLPWGMGSQYRFVLPQAVYVVIHYWTLRSPGTVPEWSAFVAGLILDVLTGGPLGFWSLVFLLGYAIALHQSMGAAGNKAARWLLLAAALAPLAVVQFLLASLYYLEWVDWRPFVLAALGVSILYPILALVLTLLEGRPKGQMPDPIGEGD